VFNGLDVRASFLDISILVDGKRKLSRNISNIPIFDAQQPRRAKSSTAPPQKPEILQVISFFEVDVCDIALWASLSVQILFSEGKWPSFRPNSSL
jgi:hypothetical protein